METRIALIEREQEDFRNVLRDLRDISRVQSESLQKLVVLEERHHESRESLARAFGVIKEHEERLQVIERELPPLHETRRWIISGVLGVLAVVGLAMLAMVVIKPASSMPYQQPPAVVYPPAQQAPQAPTR